jgi:hypothetical protein
MLRAPRVLVGAVAVILASSSLQPASEGVRRASGTGVTVA